MISTENVPKLVDPEDSDFTMQEYRRLLKTAKASYKVVGYDSIDWGSRFVLWRHDIDYSINRSLALAEAESKEGVKATYFVNPRSQFYNPFEKNQSEIIKKILSMGHSLGLHLDVTSPAPNCTDELNSRIRVESGWLTEAFGVRPRAFSFHNPNEDHLRFEDDTYGGLVNCYSKRFKVDIAYCSDSNGYWRFRRLSEVLKSGKNRYLQVLTHPGWWQDLPMSPRQRIFRSVYGRALSVMKSYDQALIEADRKNHGGFYNRLLSLPGLDTKALHLMDYLYNTNYKSDLFVTLFNLHRLQLRRLYVMNLYGSNGSRDKGVSPPEGTSPEYFQAQKDFKNFEVATHHSAGVKSAEYQSFVKLHDDIYRLSRAVPPQRFEEASEFMFEVIECTARWGTQLFRYDGLKSLPDDIT